MDSRINIKIHQIEQHDNTTPGGLLDTATSYFKGSDDHSERTLLENDEVWLVFDRDPDKRDSRGSQIETVKDHCNQQTNWFMALSNPCFEVWLYYHISEEIPDFPEMQSSSGWKDFLDKTFPGGFDSRHHPVYIETALNNAESVFKKDENGDPAICHTQMFHLAESIVPILKKKLSRALFKCR